MRKRKASQAVRAGSLPALASSRKPFTSSGRGGEDAMFGDGSLRRDRKRRFAGGLQRLLGGGGRGSACGLHNRRCLGSTRRHGGRIQRLAALTREVMSKNDSSQACPRA